MKNFTISLCAFHLKRTLDNALDGHTDDAHKLWEYLVILGEDHFDSSELKNLKSKLICYDEKGKYEHKLEQGRKNHWLIDSNQSNLGKVDVEKEFSIKLNIYPFIYKDTYAVDLALSAEPSDTLINKEQVKHFKPSHLLPISEYASLGKTLWLYGKVEADTKHDEDCKQLAEEYIKELLKETNLKYDLINHEKNEKFLNSLFFEYQVYNQEKPQNFDEKCRILITINNTDQDEDNAVLLMNKAYHSIRQLFCYYHKIYYLHYKSLEIYSEGRRFNSDLNIYTKSLNKLIQESNTSKETLNQFDELLKKTSKSVINYTNCLSKLKAYETAINLNIDKYKIYLEKINKIGECPKYWKDSQIDTFKGWCQNIQNRINYLSPNEGLFKEMVDTIRGILAIEQTKLAQDKAEIDSVAAKARADAADQQAESEQKLQTTIATIGFGVGAASVGATTSVYLIPQPNNVDVKEQKEQNINSIYSFFILFTLFFSLFYGVVGFIFSKIFISFFNQNAFQKLDQKVMMFLETTFKMNRLLKNKYYFRKAVIRVGGAADVTISKNLDDLIEGLRAVRKLEIPFLPDLQRPHIAKSALYQAVYNMRTSEINILKGHLTYVNFVVFSPNGSLIASASRDGTVRLWKANGKKLYILKGHSDSVNSVAFSPDSKTLVSGSSDKTVKLWNIEGKLLQEFTHDAAVNSVAWAPDGKTIASGGADNIIKLWNQQGKKINAWKAHSLSVTSVALSADGSKIASTSSDTTVKLWSPEGKLLQTLRGHNNTVLVVAWAPNSKMLASTGLDGTVKLWEHDGELFKLVNTILAHEQAVMSIAFSKDGKTLASASWDKTVKLWDIDGTLDKPIKQPVEILRGHNDWVTSINFSSDGQTLASSSRDASIKLWCWKYQPLKSIEANCQDVTMLSYSPQDDLIANSGQDGTVKIWSKNGKLLHTLTGHTDAVRDISFSPDGQKIASASSDATVKLWSRNGRLLSTLEKHIGKVLSVDWAPSGQILASAGEDSKIRLWSYDGKFIGELIGHSKAVNCVSFSPNGEYIASASSDKTVKVWNKDGKLINTITAHKHEVCTAVWSEDNILATASLDSTVKLWDKNWNLIKTLDGEGEGKYFISVKYSPDNEYIVAMSRDKIQLWNLQGNLKLVINAQNDTFTAIGFTSDSKKLITGNSGGKIVFHHLADTHTDKLTKKGYELLRNYLQGNTKVSKN